MSFLALFRLGVRAALSALAAGTIALTGCAEHQARPRSEDEARRMAFVPSCTRALRTDVKPTPAKRPGLSGSLRDEDIAALVFPAYLPDRREIPATAPACDGRALLSHPYLPAPAGPLFVPEGRITVASAADGLKIAWIRTHDLGDGSEAGPLALLRVEAGSVEVVALGVHRGIPSRTRLGTERLGTELVVVAAEDACTGLPPRGPCLTQTTLLVPRSGDLVVATVVDLERRLTRQGAEPGHAGNVHYRLGATMTYLAGGLRLLEQVDAVDDAGRTLRRAEAERAFALRPDGTLQTDDAPLWARVVGPP